MLEKLKAIEQRLTEVEQQLSDPAVYGDRERLTALSREQKELTPVVACYRAYLRAQDTAREAEEMLSDPELRALAQEELAGARADMERLQEELKNPEMRRLMQLPGMRMRDAYRLAHYDESLHRAAQAGEQGVVQRIQQRAARPAENGIRPGGAATVHPDVASMTRAQREALERRVLHGAQIEL